MAEFKPEKPKDARNYCIMPIAATTDKRLAKHQAAFRVLARICSYTDNVGVTFVSQDRLAADLGVSRQAINKQMRLLHEYGYLVYARKRYKGQTTNSIKVVFDGVKSEEEAYSNLTATQQMEQAERQALERLSKSDVNPQVDKDKAGATHRFTRAQPTGCRDVNPQVALNGTTNGTNNVYKESIRKMMKEYCDTADSLGQTRIINERDQSLLQGWIDSGLTFITWRAIIARHATWCKENGREFAKTLAYFREPVARELEKAGHPDVKRLVNAVIRGNKL
jgi:DNA-binding Lrp family transcriptional regulator